MCAAEQAWQWPAGSPHRQRPVHDIQGKRQGRCPCNTFPSFRDYIDLDAPGIAPSCGCEVARGAAPTSVVHFHKWVQIAVANLWAALGQCCHCGGGGMLPIFLTFGNLISGFISLVSNSLILTSYQQQQQISIFLKGIGHFDQTNIPLERICYECSGITQRSQTHLNHSRSGLAVGKILSSMSNQS